MNYTYTWADPEHSAVNRVSETGEFVSIPADPYNTDYAEFLKSGATAEESGPPPPPPTTAEKIDQLLTDYNLTRDELRAAFSATQEVPES